MYLPIFCLSAASLYGSLLHFVSVVLKRVEKYSTVRDAGTRTVNISLCLWSDVGIATCMHVTRLVPVLVAEQESVLKLLEK